MKNKQDTLKERVSGNIKEQRFLHGLTQEDLAEKINMSIATIRHWELKISLPKEDSFRVLEDFFKLPKDYFKTNEPNTVRFIESRVDGHDMTNYIGKNTREARLAKGWTLQELADKIGRSVSFISDWEYGRSPAIQANVEKFAEVLEVPMETLLKKDKVMKQEVKELSEDELLFRKTIAKNMKLLREDRGWSRYDLAKASNITPRTITKWEEERVTIRPQNLKKLAKGFGVEEYELSERELPEPRHSGEVIRRLRMKNGLTQKKLGELIDVNPTSVFAWEQGNFKPTRINRMRLEEVFGVKLRDWNTD